MSTAAAAPLPAFLLAHLDRIASAERFNSYTVHHQAGSKHGDGFMAAMVAVTLRGPRRSATNAATVRDDSLDLICKLLPDSKVRQEQFQAKTIFEREVHIYRTVLPMLRKFQLAKGLTAADGFLAYPQCYAATADAITQDYAIIMHDLRASGYALWDKLTPMPVAQARLLFEQLGRMHGVSLVLRAQRPELFAQIRALDDKMLPVLQAWRSMCDSSFSQAVRHLERPEHKRVMQQARDNWPAMIGRLVSGEAAEPFAVMGHGDCWNNNMMFEGQKSIRLLDWQICRIGSPALDIAYFLCSSTDKALRDQHYDELLRVYHCSLVALGRACGVPDDRPLLTFAQLEQQLREFGKYGVLMAPLLLQVMVSEGSQIVDMDAAALEMSQPDHDADKEMDLAVFDERSLAKYRERLGDVIDDAQRLGWI